MKYIYTKSQSQSFQESFVLNILGAKQGGTYLEIGSHHPYFLSNTFLLENDFGWKGFSVEIERKFVRKFRKQRRNSCIRADATLFDYRRYLIDNDYPKIIDYLQVDIEPAHQSLAALIRIPFDEFTFKVITFEHDAHIYENAFVRQVSRTLLSSFGYVLVAGNVKCKGNPFEDWWVHPNQVPEVNYLDFMSSNEEDFELFQDGIHI